MKDEKKKKRQTRLILKGHKAKTTVRVSTKQHRANQRGSILWQWKMCLTMCLTQLFLNILVFFLSDLALSVYQEWELDDK